MDVNLDIRSGVQVASLLAFLGVVLYLVFGFRTLQAGRRLRFFRKKQEMISRGWRMIFFSVLLLVFGFVIRSYAEPVVYSFFPPTATATLTPTVTPTSTITPTPSVTLTPTITETPSETNTATATPTPSIPLFIEAQFESTIPPSAESVFSEFQFTQGIDEDYTPLNAGVLFENPVGHLYAVFSYDKMIDGVQWTAIWYRGGEIVHFETQPWDGGTGGLGYTDWNPPSPDAWQPGEYQVVVFLGFDWYQTGFFTVQGEPPQPSASATGTPTDLPSPTSSPTVTWTPSITPSPTLTRQPSPTATVTRTSTPSRTPRPTWTPWPTVTPRTPTATGTATSTRTITPTRTEFPPTATFTPTITRQPTITNTPFPTP